MFRSWSASTRADVRTAAWGAWLIVALIGGLLAVSPYVIAQTSIQEWVGSCPAKANGDPCSLCGMTTAFYLITGGRFDDATVVNAASVPLFSVLLANFAAGVVEAGRMWRLARRRN